MRLAWSQSAWMFSILVAAFFQGCATKLPADSADDDKKVVGPAFYVLREGEKTEYQMPLPTKLQILIDWTYTDGSKLSKERFRGWDMDHDGRFDMLEVLDDEGMPVSWAYDFNGDSVIDAVEQRSRPSLDP
jgi:hypothetical protein